MLRIEFVFLLFVSTCVLGCSKKVPDLPESQQPVAAEIKTQGGLYTADKERPEIGVVAVTLQGTKIDDAFVKRLTAFPDLERLNLRATKITDQSIPTLLSLKKLTLLDVGDTKLSEKGKAELREKLADIELEGAEEAPPPMVDEGGPVD